VKLDFSKQTVLVTGATRGIGAALADAFEEAGADLLVTGTNAEKVDELNRQYRDGPRRYLAVDFLVPASLERFLGELKEVDIDVCVNNAGINRIESIDAQSREDYDAVMAVNLHAPTAIMRTLVPGMKKRRYGRIVNIASIWSRISRPGRSAYSAAKAGLAGLTRTLGVELAPHNVLVNCVSPGFTLTELTEQSLSVQERRELESRIPAGRLAEPKEMAAPVLFAASRENSYMTGQNLVVDGGFVNV